MVHTDNLGLVQSIQGCAEWGTRTLMCECVGGKDVGHKAGLLNRCQ